MKNVVSLESGDILMPRKLRIMGFMLCNTEDKKVQESLFPTEKW